MLQSCCCNPVVDLLLLMCWSDVHWPLARLMRLDCGWSTHFVSSQSRGKPYCILCLRSGTSEWAWGAMYRTDPMCICHVSGRALEGCCCRGLTSMFEHTCQASFPLSRTSAMTLALLHMHVGALQWCLQPQQNRARTARRKGGSQVAGITGCISVGGGWQCAAALAQRMRRV